MSVFRRVSHLVAHLGGGSVSSRVEFLVQRVIESRHSSRVTVAALTWTWLQDPSLLLIWHWLFCCANL